MRMVAPNMPPTIAKTMVQSEVESERRNRVSLDIAAAESERLE